MLRKRIIWVVPALLATVAAGAALPGCGTNLDPSTPLSAVMIGGTSLGDVLNRITVGDVVRAFEQFLDRIEQAHNRPNPLASLTDEQIAQIAALAADYDAGNLSREEFAEKTRQIMGDAAPDFSFGRFRFFGGPFGFHFDDAEEAGPLSLTDEQRQQARDIFERLDDDIDALRQAARDEILAVLTDEQRAKLDELLEDRFFPFGRPFGAMMGPMMSPMMASNGSAARHGPGSMFDRLADQLELTDEQREKIEAIRSKLREDIRARHQQARDEFKAILTPEQGAVLAALEAQRAEGLEHRHGEHHPGR